METTGLRHFSVLWCIKSDLILTQSVGMGDTLGRTWGLRGDGGGTCAILVDSKVPLSHSYLFYGFSGIQVLGLHSPGLRACRPGTIAI